MKKALILLFLLMTLLFNGCTDEKNKHSGFDVTIYNKTEVEIKGLNITYEHASKDIKVPDIPPQKTVKVRVDPKEYFNDNGLRLYYFDKSGNKQQEILVLYFQKGHGGNIFVEILSVDKNRKLTFKTKESEIYWVD